MTSNQITTNVVAVVDEFEVIHLVKFGFFTATNEADAVREFASGYRAGEVVSKVPELQAILDEMNEFDGTTDRNGNPVDFITGEPITDFADDGPDPDGEAAMERYYDAQACARDVNTPPQYR